VQRNDQPDDQRLGQLPFTGLSCCCLLQGASDGVLGNGPAERFDRQSLAELAFGIHLTYLESHGVTRFSSFAGSMRKYAIEVALSLI
jgi:hypothetical protein